MKKILLALAMMVAVSAFADTNTASADGTKAQSGSESSVVVGCLVNCVDTTAADTAVANINAQAARDIANINAGAKIRNTPSVSGPQLTSSNDTCMGSTSGSANGPGIGIGFGTTWTDTNCKMLKNGRELWNMGMKGAAMALMCTDSANREALELTGFECPQTARDKAKASTTAAASNEPTDPIVRARMGLPAIK